jgi:D-hydroxyproline dehydrogenase subunit gamma
VFKPMNPPTSGKLVDIQVDGREVRARAGVSLAIALMEANIVPTRHTAISNAPRAPLCLMGVCFECLCEVNGQQNAQSCMVQVSDAMLVRLAAGARRMENSK